MKLAFFFFSQHGFQSSSFFQPWFLLVLRYDQDSYIKSLVILIKGVAELHKTAMKCGRYFLIAEWY